jgi:crossover junction endodeoxyribonuclease RusA
MYKITVIGRPVPKERPRKGKSGVFYTPSKTQDYEKLVANQIAESIDWVTENDIYLNIKFYLSKRPYGDIDNYIKTILDSINRSKLIWKDDKQVTEIHAERIYDKSEEQRTEIFIEVLTE